MAKRQQKEQAKPEAEDSVIAELDMPVVHAQLANTIIVATEYLKQNHPELGATIGIQRIEGLTIAFALACSGLEGRFYLMTLVNPDGSNVNLMRFNPEDGSSFPTEEFDQVVVDALRTGLRGTVVEAYHFMVRTPVAPTHEAVTTIQ